MNSEKKNATMNCTKKKFNVNRKILNRIKMQRKLSTQSLCVLLKTIEFRKKIKIKKELKNETALKCVVVAAVVIFQMKVY